MTQLEELKSKIIKAVPEIMELKFGCKIKVGTDLGLNKVYFDEQPSGRYTYRVKIGDFIELKNLGKAKLLEILGRPITLEDVLRALGSKPDFRTTIGRGLIVFWKNNKNDIRLFDWRLGRYLDEQFEDSIKWLNDNIK